MDGWISWNNFEGAVREVSVREDRIEEAFGRNVYIRIGKLVNEIDREIYGF